MQNNTSKKLRVEIRGHSYPPFIVKLCAALFFLFGIILICSAPLLIDIHALVALGALCMGMVCLFLFAVCRKAISIYKTELKYAEETDIYSFSEQPYELHPEQANRRNHQFVLNLIVFAALFTAIAIAVNSCYDDGKNDADDQRLSARVAAQLAVEDYLVSPKTAEYPASDEWTVTHSDNIWTISSYVDAQNAYGAILRSKFTVKIDWDGQSEKYIIKYVEIGADVYVNNMRTAIDTKTSAITSAA